MNQPGTGSENDQPAEPGDTTGWAQPPAPGGAPEAFVNRQDYASGSLPPGAGSPLQPGPPLSVEAPIRDTTFNLGAIGLLLIGGVILLVIVAVILFVIVGVAHGSPSR